MPNVTASCQERHENMIRVGLQLQQGKVPDGEGSRHNKPTSTLASPRASRKTPVHAKEPEENAGEPEQTYATFDASKDVSLPTAVCCFPASPATTCALGQYKEDIPAEEYSPRSQFQRYCRACRSQPPQSRTSIAFYTALGSHASRI